MARSFSAGNYLRNNGGVTGIDNAISVLSIWLRWDGSIAATNGLIAQSIDATTAINRWIAYASGAGFRLRLFQGYDGVTTTSRWNTTEQTQTGWFNLLVQYTRNLGGAHDPVVYIDNALEALTQTLTGTGSVVTGQDTITLGADRTGGIPAVDFAIGEVAFWAGITMGADDRQALADGTPAWQVRPDALVWNPPVDDSSGDENELVAGEYLTETGTCPYVPGPPISGLPIGFEAATVGHVANNPIARWANYPHFRKNAGEQLKLSVFGGSGQHEEKMAGIHSVEFTVTPPSGVEYDPAGTVPGADVPYTHIITEQTLNPDLASDDFPNGLWCYNTDSDDTGDAIDVDDFDGPGEVTVEAVVRGEDGGIRDKSTQVGKIVDVNGAIVEAGLWPFKFIVDPDSGTPADARPAPRAFVDIDGNGVNATGSDSHDGLDMLGFDVAAGDWVTVTGVLTKVGAFTGYTKTGNEIVYLASVNAGESGWYQVDDNDDDTITCTLVSGTGIASDEADVTSSDGPTASIHAAFVALETWRNAYDANAIIDGGTVYCIKGNYSARQADNTEIVTSDEWARVTRAPDSSHQQVIFNTQGILTRTKLYWVDDVTVSGHSIMQPDNGLADNRLLWTNVTGIGYGKTDLLSTAGVIYDGAAKTLTLEGAFVGYTRANGDVIRIADETHIEYWSINRSGTQTDDVVTLLSLRWWLNGGVADGATTVEGTWRGFPLIQGPLKGESGAYAVKNWFVNCSLFDSAAGIRDDSYNGLTVELVHGMHMERIGNDAFHGGPGCITNIFVKDCGAGVAGENDAWHSDAWQFGSNLNPQQNLIVANCRATNVGRQGLLINAKNVDHQDFLIMNMYLEQDPESIYTLWLGGDHIDHLVIWHSTFRWKGDDPGLNQSGVVQLYENANEPETITQLSNMSVEANIMSRVSTRFPNDDVAKVVLQGNWNENHFEYTGMFRLNALGDPYAYPRFWDSLGRNFTTGSPGLTPYGRIQVGATAQHGFDDFLPADLEGEVRSLGTCGAYIGGANILGGMYFHQRSRA